MKSGVLGGVGEAVRLQDVPDLVPAAGEAVVRLRAAALNRRDVWIRKGQYAGLKFPIILGSDGVGTVAAVGSDADMEWLGREVVVNPSLAWGDRETTQNPATFRILGLPDDGTFAETVRVPVANLYTKPAHMSDSEAAALPLAGLTAFRAISSRGRLVAGERVLVTGAGGGAATFAIQIARALGAEVYATSGRQEKLDQLAAYGVAGGVNYRDEAWASRLKEMAGGFDLIIDSAGGEGFANLLDLANPGGRIVFFGATAGNPPGLDMRRVFWKQLTLCGTTMGSPSDFRGLIDLYSAHQLRPIVDKIYPLAEANDALDRMENAEQLGKIVLTIP